jgi:hypothetical protein
MKPGACPGNLSAKVFFKEGRLAVHNGWNAKRSPVGWEVAAMQKNGVVEVAY